MKIGKLGLGSSNIASLGRALSSKDAVTLFRYATQLGINVIDTANTYGSGDSERLISKAIEGLKRDFFIITKAGFPCASFPGWASPLNQFAKKIIQKTHGIKDFSPLYLEKALHKSLKRLKMDTVGAFVLHEPNSGDNITDETWRALEKVKSKGMAEFTGISSSDLNLIKIGIANKQLDIVETPISFKASHYKEILMLCEKNNIPVVANQIFAPLTDLNIEKTKQITTIALQYGYSNLSIRNILIAYTHSLFEVSCVLFGTTNIDHLKNNVDATSTKLSEDFFKKVEQVFNY